MGEKFKPLRSRLEEEHSSTRTELYTLLGIDDSLEQQEEIDANVAALRSQINNAPKVGRVIEAESAIRKEFIIAVTSKAQQEALLDALYTFGIFPWEEDGLLVIDRKKDIQKLELAGLIRPEKEKEEVLPQPSVKDRASKPTNTSKKPEKEVVPALKSRKVSVEEVATLGPDIDAKRFAFPLPRYVLRPVTRCRATGRRNSP